ncbi:MAG: Ppx/GppA phosphatase family protein [Mariprofundaceae bacterium]|nr:Ppx/GppA phosphatase family protein [Mariprofundaceae bacterium]
MTHKLYASIDIGSNTFRLLIARKNNDKNATTPWHMIAYTHRIIRLGEGLHQSGKLCDAAMQRALSAFHEFSKLLKEHHIKSSQLSAVATAAMRDAENGQTFCQQVEKETGIHIQIIDGEQEANNSLAGSCAVLPSSIRDDFLLFDIGGGSTEFVRAESSKNIDAISRKMGVVRLVETYLQRDPPSQQDYKAMKAACHQHLDVVEQYWQKENSQIVAPKYLVGTAGTVTTLAAIDLGLIDYNADIVNNHCISKQRFSELRDQLLAMTHQERQSIPAIEKGRADLMIAGLAIIESIFERWHYEYLITVDAGLLEGAWLNISNGK